MLKLQEEEEEEGNKHEFMWMKKQSHYKYSNTFLANDTWRTQPKKQCH